MIPREAHYATPTVSLRRPFAPLVRHLRAAGRATTRLLRQMIDIDNPQRAWTFDVVGARVYCADDEKLAIYHPTDDAQHIACENPCDLREWA